MAAPHQSPRIQTQQHDGVSWVDVHNPGPDTFRELEQQFRVHPLHLRESLQKIQHAEVDHEEDYLFFVLRVPVRRGQERKIRVQQVGIFLGKNYLITIHDGTVAAITELFEECDATTDGEDFKQGAGFVLYQLMARLIRIISDLTEAVTAELEDIEDMVFDERRSDAHQIALLRQRIIRLRGIIGPKRLLLQDLAEQADSFVGHSLAKYYEANAKALNRLWEIIEEAKDTVEIYKDADFTASTERTNKTLAVLTLIFTFTIPVTVLGTVYGMNILLPGSVNGRPWRFWGDYTTLILALGMSVLAAGFMYMYFKKKRWI